MKKFAGEWQVLENGSRWRMGGAGEGKARENGSRWRMVVAGEGKARENGSRWRMVVAGEWEALEKERRGRISCSSPLFSPFSARRDQKKAGPKCLAHYTQSIL